jgi:hypothetical protein
MPTDRVSNAPFRAAFLSSGLTAYEAAREAGWMRRQTENRSDRKHRVREIPDASKLRRVLGLAKQDGKLRDTIAEPDALKLLTVFPSLDPVDVDL